MKVLSPVAFGNLGPDGDSRGAASRHRPSVARTFRVPGTGVPPGRRRTWRSPGATSATRHGSQRQLRRGCRDPLQDCCRRPRRNQPELAEAVTSRHEAIGGCDGAFLRQPLLLYPSSLTVFGVTRTSSLPRRRRIPWWRRMPIRRHQTGRRRPPRRPRFPGGVPDRRFRWTRARSQPIGDAAELLAVRADKPARVRPSRRRRARDGQRVERRIALKRRTLLIGGGPALPVTSPCSWRGARSRGAAVSERITGATEYYTDWWTPTRASACSTISVTASTTIARDGAALRWVRRLLWPLRPLLNPLLASFVQRLTAASRFASWCWDAGLSRAASDARVAEAAGDRELLPTSPGVETREEGFRRRPGSGTVLGRPRRRPGETERTQPRRAPFTNMR